MKKKIFKKLISFINGVKGNLNPKPLVLVVFSILFLITGLSLTTPNAYARVSNELDYLLGTEATNEGEKASLGTQNGDNYSTNLLASPSKNGPVSTGMFYKEDGVIYKLQYYVWQETKGEKVNESDKNVSAQDLVGVYAPIDKVDTYDKSGLTGQYKYYENGKTYNYYNILGFKTDFDNGKSDFEFVNANLTNGKDTLYKLTLNGQFVNNYIDAYIKYMKDGSAEYYKTQALQTINIVYKYNAGTVSYDNIRLDDYYNHYVNAINAVKNNYKLQVEAPNEINYYVASNGEKIYVDEAGWKAQYETSYVYSNLLHIWDSSNRTFLQFSLSDLNKFNFISDSEIASLSKKQQEEVVVYIQNNKLVSDIYRKRDLITKVYKVANETKNTSTIYIEEGQNLKGNSKNGNTLTVEHDISSSLNAFDVTLNYQFDYVPTTSQYLYETKYVRQLYNYDFYEAEYYKTKSSTASLLSDGSADTYELRRTNDSQSPIIILADKAWTVNEVTSGRVYATFNRYIDEFKTIQSASDKYSTVSKKVVKDSNSETQWSSDRGTTHQARSFDEEKQDYIPVNGFLYGGKYYEAEYTETMNEVKYKERRVNYSWSEYGDPNTISKKWEYPQRQTTSTLSNELNRIQGMDSGSHTFLTNEEYFKRTNIRHNETQTFTAYLYNGTYYRYFDSGYKLDSWQDRQHIFNGEVNVVSALDTTPGNGKVAYRVKSVKSGLYSNTVVNYEAGATYSFSNGRKIYFDFDTAKNWAALKNAGASNSHSGENNTSPQAWRDIGLTHRTEKHGWDTHAVYELASSNYTSVLYGDQKGKLSYDRVEFGRGDAQFSSNSSTTFNDMDIAWISDSTVTRYKITTSSSTSLPKTKYEANPVYGSYTYVGTSAFSSFSGSYMNEYVIGEKSLNNKVGDVVEIERIVYDVVDGYSYLKETWTANAQNQTIAPQVDYHISWGGTYRKEGNNYYWTTNDKIYSHSRSNQYNVGRNSGGNGGYKINYEGTSERSFNIYYYKSLYEMQNLSLKTFNAKPINDLLIGGIYQGNIDSLVSKINSLKTGNGNLAYSVTSNTNSINPDTKERTYTLTIASKINSGLSSQLIIKQKANYSYYKWSGISYGAWSADEVNKDYYVKTKYTNKLDLSSVPGLSEASPTTSVQISGLGTGTYVTSETVGNGLSAEYKKIERDDFIRNYYKFVGLSAGEVKTLYNVSGNKNLSGNNSAFLQNGKYFGDTTSTNITSNVSSFLPKYETNSRSEAWKIHTSPKLLRLYTDTTKIIVSISFDKLSSYDFNTLAGSGKPYHYQNANVINAVGNNTAIGRNVTMGEILSKLDNGTGVQAQDTYRYKTGYVSGVRKFYTAKRTVITTTYTAENKTLTYGSTNNNLIGNTAKVDEYGKYPDVNININGKITNTNGKYNLTSRTTSTSKNLFNQALWYETINANGLVKSYDTNSNTITLYNGTNSDIVVKASNIGYYDPTLNSLNTNMSFNKANYKMGYTLNGNRNVATYSDSFVTFTIPAKKTYTLKDMALSSDGAYTTPVEILNVGNIKQEQFQKHSNAVKNLAYVDFRPEDFNNPHYTDFTNALKNSLNIQTSITGYAGIGNITNEESLVKYFFSQSSANSSFDPAKILYTLSYTLNGNKTYIVKNGYVSELLNEFKFNLKSPAQIGSGYKFISTSKTNKLYFVQDRDVIATFNKDSVLMQDKTKNQFENVTGTGTPFANTNGSFFSFVADAERKQVYDKNSVKGMQLLLKEFNNKHTQNVGSSFSDYTFYYNGTSFSLIEKEQVNGTVKEAIYYKYNTKTDANKTSGTYIKNGVTMHTKLEKGFERIKFYLNSNDEIVLAENYLVNPTKNDYLEIAKLFGAENNIIDYLDNLFKYDKSKYRLLFRNGKIQLQDIYDVNNFDKAYSPQYDKKALLISNEMFKKLQDELFYYTNGSYYGTFKLELDNDGLEFKEYDLHYNPSKYVKDSLIEPISNDKFYSEVKLLSKVEGYNFYEVKYFNKNIAEKASFAVLNIVEKDGYYYIDGKNENLYYAYGLNIWFTKKITSNAFLQDYTVVEFKNVRDIIDVKFGINTNVNDLTLKEEMPNSLLDYKFDNNNTLPRYSLMNNKEKTLIVDDVDNINILDLGQYNGGKLSKNGTYRLRWTKPGEIKKVSLQGGVETPFMPTNSFKYITNSYDLEGSAPLEREMNSFVWSGDHLFRLNKIKSGNVIYDFDKSMEKLKLQFLKVFAPTEKADFDITVAFEEAKWWEPATGVGGQAGMKPYWRQNAVRIAGNMGRLEFKNNLDFSSLTTMFYGISEHLQKENSPVYNNMYPYPKYKSEQETFDKLLNQEYLYTYVGGSTDPSNGSIKYKNPYYITYDLYKKVKTDILDMLGISINDLAPNVMNKVYEVDNQAALFTNYMYDMIYAYDLVNNNLKDGNSLITKAEFDEKLNEFGPEAGYFDYLFDNNPNNTLSRGLYTKLTSGLGQPAYSVTVNAEVLVQIFDMIINYRSNNYEDTYNSPTNDFLVLNQGNDNLIYRKQALNEHQIFQDYYRTDDGFAFLSEETSTKDVPSYYKPSSPDSSLQDWSEPNPVNRKGTLLSEIFNGELTHKMYKYDITNFDNLDDLRLHEDNGQENNHQTKPFGEKISYTMPSRHNLRLYRIRYTYGWPINYGTKFNIFYDDFENVFVSSNYTYNIYHGQVKGTKNTGISSEFKITYATNGKKEFWNEFVNSKFTNPTFETVNDTYTNLANKYHPTKRYYYSSTPITYLNGWNGGNYNYNIVECDGLTFTGDIGRTSNSTNDREKNAPILEAIGQENILTKDYSLKMKIKEEIARLTITDHNQYGVKRTDYNNNSFYLSVPMIGGSSTANEAGMYNYFSPALVFSPYFTTTDNNGSEQKNITFWEQQGREISIKPENIDQFNNDNFKKYDLLMPSRNLGNYKYRNFDNLEYMTKTGNYSNFDKVSQLFNAFSEIIPEKQSVFNNTFVLRNELTSYGYTNGQNEGIVRWKTLADCYSYLYSNYTMIRKGSEYSDGVKAIDVSLYETIDDTHYNLVDSDNKPIDIDIYKLGDSENSYGISINSDGSVNIKTTKYHLIEGFLANKVTGEFIGLDISSLGQNRRVYLNEIERNKAKLKSEDETSWSNFNYEKLEEIVQSNKKAMFMFEDNSTIYEITNIYNVRIGETSNVSLIKNKWLSKYIFKNHMDFSDFSFDSTFKINNISLLTNENAYELVDDLNVKQTDTNYNNISTSYNFNFNYETSKQFIFTLYFVDESNNPIYENLEGYTKRIVNVNGKNETRYYYTFDREFASKTGITNNTILKDIILKNPSKDLRLKDINSDLPVVYNINLGLFGYGDGNVNFENLIGNAKYRLDFYNIFGVKQNSLIIKTGDDLVSNPFNSSYLKENGKVGVDVTPLLPDSYYLSSNPNDYYVYGSGAVIKGYNGNKLIENKEYISYTLKQAIFSNGDDKYITSPDGLKYYVSPNYRLRNESSTRTIDKIKLYIKDTSGNNVSLLGNTVYYQNTKLNIPSTKLNIVNNEIEIDYQNVAFKELKRMITKYVINADGLISADQMRRFISQEVISNGLFTFNNKFNLPNATTNKQNKFNIFGYFTFVSKKAYLDLNQDGIYNENNTITATNGKFTDFNNNVITSEASNAFNVGETIGIYKVNGKDIESNNKNIVTGTDYLVYTKDKNDVLNKIDGKQNYDLGFTLIKKNNKYLISAYVDYDKPVLT